MRILIAGAPRTGKTTLAEKVSVNAQPYDPNAEPRVGMLTANLPVRHTDDLIATHEWSAASEEVSRWIDEAGDWIIEGVAVVRALRKWLERHPGKKPCDAIYWSMANKVPLNAGQLTMAKGCERIWNQVRPEVAMRGVPIYYF